MRGLVDSPTGVGKKKSRLALGLAGAPILAAVLRPFLGRHQVQFGLLRVELALPLNLEICRSTRQLWVPTATNRTRQADCHLEELPLGRRHVALTATLRVPQCQLKTLAKAAQLQFTQFVSRFTRAYDAALSAEGISRADAASTAGLHPSTLSRIMSDELGAAVENVERLLRALPKREDRLHCLREYLFDHTPEEYRAELVVHFGAVAEARPQRDALRDALDALEDAATSDKDLRRLITDLARVVIRPERATSSEPSIEILPESKPMYVSKGGKLHTGELPHPPRKR